MRREATTNGCLASASMSTMEDAEWMKWHVISRRRSHSIVDCKAAKKATSMPSRIDLRCETQFSTEFMQRSFGYAS
jgi:hypothetical protein